MTEVLNQSNHANHLNQSIAHIGMPMRMRQLPISDKGYPVPWFVAWLDGIPDFRVVGPGKIETAISKNKCWLCGEPLGSYKCFVIGPMCSINRVSSEPSSHLDCAVYAVKACPFLTKPGMRRNKENMPSNQQAPAGIMIERNPGVSLLWVTKSYSPFMPKGSKGGVLFNLGDPTTVLWYSEGRVATRAEAEEAIRTGLPELEKVAADEGHDAIQALKRMVEQAKRFLP